MKLRNEFEHGPVAVAAAAKSGAVKVAVGVYDHAPAQGRLPPTPLLLKLYIGFSRPSSVVLGRQFKDRSVVINAAVVSCAVEIVGSVEDRARFVG